MIIPIGYCFSIYMYLRANFKQIPAFNILLLINTKKGCINTKRIPIYRIPGWIKYQHVGIETYLEEGLLCTLIKNNVLYLYESIERQ